MILSVVIFGLAVAAAVEGRIEIRYRVERFKCWLCRDEGCWLCREKS